MPGNTFNHCAHQFTTAYTLVDATSLRYITDVALWGIQGVRARKAGNVKAGVLLGQDVLQAVRCRAPLGVRITR